MRLQARRAMLTPDDLLAFINQAAPGLTLAELLVLQPQLPRRTAQRWIGQLIDDKALVALGAARARRYYVTTPRVEQMHVLRQERAPYAPALSADARDILAYIDQPLHARHPVGYQREFLQDYQPNQTWYLPEPMRRQLHQLGRTAQPDAPAGTYTRAILNRLLIDLSWASSNLEGNTYTWLDTRELLQHGKVADGKARQETQMLLNHKSAIEFLVENIADIGFDRYTLLNLHSILAENLLPDRRDEGRIRQHEVGIGQSIYRPLFVPQVIEAMFDTLLEKAGQILDPFEQSFFIMVHLPYLQPFADVNKRTSRLAANLPLIRANLCPLTFLDVPEPTYTRAMLGVYEMTRIELLRDLYLWAYTRSTREYLVLRQNLAEPDPARLAYRDLIRQAVRNVVRQPQDDPMDLMPQLLAQVDAKDQAIVQALLVDELRNLHEGALARYGLRPAEFRQWQAQQAQA